MSKYDFTVDLSNDTSTGLILNKIGAGSAVLEFGCATGRMTRYMKDVLNCKVYIVEYEQSAFDVAIQYAEDGVCDDILNFTWMEKFKDVKFDVIMFADVLEHLSNPQEALMKAKELLRDDGSIYVSIPNVTHNDILLKEMNNHFDYTKVGLLDDTHIHFWGLENIYSFVKTCGLKLRTIEATYCQTGMTEQFSEEKLDVNPLLHNYFSDRLCGEVYQFVLSLDQYSEETENLIKYPVVKSHIYVDSGNGFSQEELIEFDVQRLKTGEYHAHYVIDECSKIKRLRFDPTEYQGCIVKYISIRQGKRELEYSYSDAIEFETGILLIGNDPMIFVRVEDEDTPIVLDAEFLLPGEKYVDELRNVCTEKERNKNQLIAEKRDLHNEIANLNEKLNSEIARFDGEKQVFRSENAKLSRENEELNNDIIELTRENEKLNNKITELTRENEKSDNEIARLCETKNRLHGEIDAYVRLVNQKDQCLIEKENQLAELLNNKRGGRLEKLILRACAWIKKKIKRIFGKQEMTT